MQHVRCYRCGHRVEDVVPPFERQFVFTDRQRIRLREAVRIECRTQLNLLHLAVNNRVLRPVDERVFFRLIARNTELGVNVVLELVVVSVQMIRSDIQQDGDVGLKIIHIIQLERRQFNHIVVMVLMRHLQCQRITDITSQTDVQTGLFQDVENQRGSGCLAVRTGDTNHLGVRITCCELNLRDDGSSLRLQFLNQWRG